MPDKAGLEQPETTSLRGKQKRAQTCKDHRFRNLYREINAGLLHACWRDLNKKAASGVDAVTAQDYEQELGSNIDDLVERLKTKRYRAKLVRRVYIPKEGGKQRPLGIPALEDKLVQLACAKLLGAIYEQDFLPCSYGYRPGRSAKDAVTDLGFNLQYGSYGWVVEADIKGYFDHIDHDWLLEMLSLRIDDKAFLTLIRHWLKAGILDTDGQVLHPVTGSPQGGIVSPILANVYLHYALDLWFERVAKARCAGDAFLVRYADDFVACFRYQIDAVNFYEALPKRLDKFGLQVAAEKTRIGRYNVKRGAMIMVSPWTAHRNELLWRNAELFDPDRFAKGARDDDRGGVLMSFGLGPRICIGAAFATVESSLILARLVRRFDVETLEPEKVRPVARLTTRPAEEIRCRIRRRVGD